MSILAEQIVENAIRESLECGYTVHLMYDADVLDYLRAQRALEEAPVGWYEFSGKRWTIRMALPEADHG